MKTQTVNGLLVSRHVSETRDYELLDELETLAGCSWWERLMQGPTIDNRRGAIRDELERRLALRHEKASMTEKAAVQP